MAATCQDTLEDSENSEAVKRSLGNMGLWMARLLLVLRLMIVASGDKEVVSGKQTLLPFVPPISPGIRSFTHWFRALMWTLPVIPMVMGICGRIPKKKAWVWEVLLLRYAQVAVQVYMLAVAVDTTRRDAFRFQYMLITFCSWLIEMMCCCTEIAGILFACPLYIRLAPFMLIHAAACSRFMSQEVLPGDFVILHVFLCTYIVAVTAIHHVALAFSTLLLRLHQSKLTIEQQRDSYIGLLEKATDGCCFLVESDEGLRLTNLSPKLQHLLGTHTQDIALKQIVSASSDIELLQCFLQEEYAAKSNPPPTIITLGTQNESGCPNDILEFSVRVFPFFPHGGGVRCCFQLASEKRKVEQVRGLYIESSDDDHDLQTVLGRSSQPPEKAYGRDTPPTPTSPEGEEFSKFVSVLKRDSEVRSLFERVTRGDMSDTQSAVSMTSLGYTATSNGAFSDSVVRAQPVRSAEVPFPSLAEVALQAGAMHGFVRRSTSRRHTYSCFSFTETQSPEINALVKCHAQTQTVGTQALPSKQKTCDGINSLVPPTLLETALMCGEPGLDGNHHDIRVKCCCSAPPADVDGAGFPVRLHIMPRFSKGPRCPRSKARTNTSVGFVEPAPELAEFLLPRQMSCGVDASGGPSSVDEEGPSEMPSLLERMPQGFDALSGTLSCTFSQVRNPCESTQTDNDSHATASIAVQTEVATLTTHHPRPPRPYMGSHHPRPHHPKASSSNCAARTLISKKPFISKFSVTPSSTVVHLVEELIRQLSPPGSGGCCCGHMSLSFLAKVVAKEMRNRCNTVPPPNMGWQCFYCLALNQDDEDNKSEDDDDVVECSSCCVERRKVGDDVHAIEAEGSGSTSLADGSGTGTGSDWTNDDN